jgi:hypothetical protein
MVTVVVVILHTMDDRHRKYYLDRNELVNVNYHERIKAKDIHVGYAFLNGIVDEVYTMEMG